MELVDALWRAGMSAVSPLGATGIHINDEAWKASQYTFEKMGAYVIPAAQTPS